MKAKFIREYRSKKPNTLGQKRYSYKMLGTEAEIAAFKAQQGEFFLETETGDVLWNRTEDFGNSPEIVVTQEGKFTMVLDEDQVAYEKAEKRPLFAQMYFNQAQERKALSVTASTKRKAVVSTEPSL